jgi:hypothetical protein
MHRVLNFCFILKYGTSGKNVRDDDKQSWIAPQLRTLEVSDRFWVRRPTFLTEFVILSVIRFKCRGSNSNHATATSCFVLPNSLVTKRNSVALVRKRTILTERPSLVGEVSANFCG